MLAEDETAIIRKTAYDERSDTLQGFFSVDWKLRTQMIISVLKIFLFPLEMMLSPMIDWSMLSNGARLLTSLD